MDRPCRDHVGIFLCVAHWPQGACCFLISAFVIFVTVRRTWTCLLSKSWVWHCATVPRARLPLGSSKTCAPLCLRMIRKSVPESRFWGSLVPAMHTTMAGSARNHHRNGTCGERESIDKTKWVYPNTHTKCNYYSLVPFFINLIVPFWNFGQGSGRARATSFLIGHFHNLGNPT